jgi:hypothetical protein
MKSIAKADATIRELKSTLDQRVQGGQLDVDTVRSTKDADGYPMLVLSIGGDETATNPVIAIRMRANDAVSKDIFGNANVAFAPHTIEIASEDAVPSRKDLAIVDAEVAKLNIKIQVKVIAAGVAVNEANINSAAPVAVIDWLQFPTKLG